MPGWGRVNVFCLIVERSRGRVTECSVITETLLFNLLTVCLETDNRGNNSEFCSFWKLQVVSKPHKKMLHLGKLFGIMGKT